MEKLLTRKELEAHYANEWVAFQVVQWQGSSPKRGKVIAHSQKKEEVLEALLVFRRAHPQAPFALFFTGPLIPEGMSVVLYAS